MKNLTWRRVAARTIMAGALALSGGAACAQTVGDDVRCLFLSNAFASGAKDPARRQMAATTGAFYLGRLDGRASPAAIKAAFAQNGRLNTAEGGRLMTACVERASRADAQMRALLGPASAGR